MADRHRLTIEIEAETIEQMKGSLAQLAAEVAEVSSFGDLRLRAVRGGGEAPGYAIWLSSVTAERIAGLRAEADWLETQLRSAA